MTFGQFLRNHRVRRQWSQEELAERLAVSRQTIIALEKDQHAPSLDLAIRIAHLLNLSLDALANVFHQRSVQPQHVLWLSEPARSAPVPVIWSSVRGALVLVPATLAALSSLPDAIWDPATHTASPLPSARPPESVVLMGGCDPFMPWLKELFLQGSPGFHLETLPMSSMRALESWRSGLLHIAGTHLYDAASGRYNPDSWGGPESWKVPYLMWEEGLLQRPGVGRATRLAIREPGSEAHALFQRHGPTSLTTEVFTSHHALLDAVLTHEGWAGVGLGPMAGLAGLEFMPWATEHYDLWIHGTDRREPWAHHLLDILASPALHARLDALPHLHRP